MPLPLITESIPPQQFEVILQMLAAILDTEFGNQFSLDDSYPNINKVWIERVYSFDTETELPTINIGLRKGDYDNADLLKQEGTYVFNIDVYTMASTSELNGPGDQYSIILMEKIMGMIRAILSFQGYNMPGIVSPNSNGMEVISMAILDKATVKDALSTMVGRVQLMVKCEEENQIFETGTVINESTTSVKVNGSIYGFFTDYKLNNITVSTTGNTLTNAAFTVPIAQIIVLGVTPEDQQTIYSEGTDFAQNDTTLTATTFEFTAGQKIIATT